MAHLIVPRPRQAAAPAADQPEPRPADPEGVFWRAAIGAGAGALVELAARIDVLVQPVAQLPLRTGLTRPVVGQYLCMVKTLASAWTLHSRPALLAALDGLVHFGDSVGQSFALEAAAGRGIEHGRAALRVAEALQRRLAAPTTAFSALGADFASYKAQMARITAELDADTRLVTERLQADHVHVFLLSQQASTLQARLDEAALMEQARWLDSPNGHARRQQAQAHASALDDVRRQLALLRGEQAATRAEADYLQEVLPSVAPYLAAVERFGAATVAVVDGMQALGVGLAELKLALAADPRALPGAAAQLAAALPHWQALAAAAAGLTRPGAIRT